jgi:CubicO group peptidase (beta-lactamase class C family)
MHDLQQRVAAVVASALDEDRIVGAVVGIMHRGELVLLEAFGHADREAGSQMQSDAIFLLASATKPIATAAIVALAERGVLDLDADVTAYLPDFRPRHAGRDVAMTLRQLLTHTSGLSYPFREPPGSPYHQAGVGTGLDQPGLTAAEQLRRLGSVPLRFAPGTQWNYSLGVDVAGLAAAAAAGRSLPSLVAEFVTDPLGMHDTAFGVRDPGRLVAHYGIDREGRPLRMTDGYEGPSTAAPARFHPSRLMHPHSYPSAGGGMAGTAADLLRFIEALRVGGGPILGPAGIAAMTTNALPPSIPDALEPGWGYGVGTEVLTDPGRAIGPERLGAFKGSGGYGHRWFVDRALELSAVVLTNSTPEGVRGAFVEQMRAAVYSVLGNGRSSLTGEPLRWMNSP